MADAEEAAISDVLTAEEQRCRAISTKDWDALASLLTEDFTFTHGTGRTETKAEYCTGLMKKPGRTIRRSNLMVRLRGDVAIMTGDLSQTSEATSTTPQAPPIEQAVLQVWSREADSGWRLSAYQTTIRTAE